MIDRFKQIVDEHNGILYKIGRSYTTIEPDFKDLYQEMLIQLWKSMPNFKGKSKVSTFIYRVALNTALTYTRNQSRKPKTNPMERVNYKIADEGGAAIEAMREKEAKLELLYKCINLLKREERAIILLHLEGKKYEEIAHIIGLTTSHVGVKLKRIRERLQKLLKKEQHGRV